MVNFPLPCLNSRRGMIMYKPWVTWGWSPDTSGSSRTSSPHSHCGGPAPRKAATNDTIWLWLYNSLPWKIQPFSRTVNHLFRLGPSIPWRTVTNNQRVNGFINDDVGPRVGLETGKNTRKNTNNPQEDHFQKEFASHSMQRTSRRWIRIFLWIGFRVLCELLTVDQWEFQVPKMEVR